MSKSNVITRFIWSFQRHFRSSTEIAARHLFQGLDKRFSPKIFLVAIREEESASPFDACVEPEDDFWAQSEAFEGLADDIDSRIKDDPESQLFHSHPRVHEIATERIRRRAISASIQDTIENISGRPAEMVHFVGWPTRKDGFWVSVVLLLQKEIWESHPQLAIDSIPLHEYRSFTVPRSLADATVQVFLEVAQKELEQPNAGEGFGQFPTNHMLRDAAARFVRSIGTRVNVDTGNRNFFHDFNSISSLRLEKADAGGAFVIANSDHPAIQSKVRFADSTSLGSDKAARKLLELASLDVPLQTDSESVLGLCVVNDYDDSEENLFVVKVTGHHQWELHHADDCLMIVKYGEPALLSLGLDRVKLRGDLPRIFPGLSAVDTDLLVRLVEQAVREQHGTMLLISEAAEAEAARLSTQATCVEPFKLDPDILARLTPIDGAVILSPTSTCHAIGAILDGLATNHGDPTRGARFNSAIRYVAGSQQNCMAVVVSEDGGVTCMPDLPPKICRQEIESRIEELKEFDSAVSANREFPIRRFFEIRDWFKMHAFYCLSSDCNQLNKLLPKLQEFVDRDSTFRIDSTYKFTPHGAMKPELFYSD